MFRFFTSDESTALSLFVHLCADFGAAGTPGTFKIFFVDVVVNMARSLRILTLNMPVNVDDLCLIGACREQVDCEMEAFHAWAGAVCGAEGDHAEFSLGWGHASAEVYTHKVDGLTRADAVLAAKLDGA